MFSLRFVSRKVYVHFWRVLGTFEMIVYLQRAFDEDDSIKVGLDVHPCHNARLCQRDAGKLHGDMIRA